MPQRFHEWTFEDGLLTAHSAEGRQVRFTRQERIVLAQLLAAPGELVTRRQLLDVLPRHDGKNLEGSDRQVDYLITRLRRHLGDSARQPRFIATQYGDGYRWMAPTPAPAPVPEGIFLAIQPLHRDMPPAAQSLSHMLCEALNQRISAPGNRLQSTAIAPPPPWKPAPDGACAFVLDISAWADGSTLHAALLLRDARTRQSLYPLRVTHPLAHGHGQLAAQGNAQAIADALAPHIWSHQALATNDAPTAPPLELRLHEAACLFGEPQETWRQSLAYAGQLDQSHPHAVRDLTRATALLARIVLQSPRTQWLSPGEWDAHEAEIEQLVLPHLSGISGQPLLELAAARLLGAAGEQHAGTAFTLARNGFAHTTAFAAAMPTLGQCHVRAGDFGTAHALYDRSLELSEPGSQFQAYLLTLRCLACLGSGDHEALVRCRTDLFQAHPQTQQTLGLLLHSPDPELPAHVSAALAQWPTPLLQAVAYLLQRQARTLYGQAAHRHNMLRGVARHLAQGHGPEILDPELRTLVQG